MSLDLRRQAILTRQIAVWLVYAALPLTATAQEPNVPARLVVDAETIGHGDIIEVDSGTSAHRIDLGANQSVRPRGSGRATIVVSDTRWIVNADDVHFERVDFVWEPEAAQALSGEHSAMVTVSGNRVTFANCSWRADGGRIAAVGWRPDLRQHVPGHLHFDGCRFHAVAAGIAFEPSDLATVEASDTLHVGPGALVRLSSWPKKGQCFALLLDHATVRAPAGLLDVVSNPLEGGLGRIAVHAVESVFAPLGNAPLVVVRHVQEPSEWLRYIRWTGDGSIMAEDCPIVSWMNASNRSHRVADSAIRVSGLVRGDIRFADGDLSMPTSSRLAEWSAPLKSTRDPGISAGHEPSRPVIIPASNSE